MTGYFFPRLTGAGDQRKFAVKLPVDNAVAVAEFAVAQGGVKGGEGYRFRSRNSISSAALFRLIALRSRFLRSCLIGGLLEIGALVEGLAVALFCRDEAAVESGRVGVFAGGVVAADDF